MNNKEVNINLAKLYAAVADDDALKKRFQAEPLKVLKEFGIDVPASVNVTVHENTKDSVHLVIPVKSGIDVLAGGGIGLRI